MECIVVGDLNAPPHAPEMQWFIQEGKFSDLFARFHPKDPGYTWDNRNRYAANCHHKMPDRRIDQVLVRNRGSVLSKAVACQLVLTEPDPRGIWASDHFAVLAEFK